MSVVRASLKGLQASSPIPDVPDAPVIGTATNVGTSRAFNNGSATVTYTAAATGGTPVSYTITSSPGGFTGTGSSPVTITGLQSNTSYTFTGSATNTTATSTVSTASSSITATTVPATISAPTATNVGSSRAFNNGSASVAFTAPSTGGSAITGYAVTSSPGGFTASGASSPLTVTGLQSSTQYTYTVTATNTNGTSTASSASDGVTATTVPAAPTVGSPTGGNASISVPFTAGATGGSAITGYTVTSSPGSFTGSGASSPITVSGLSNGTSYTFTVTATNANGTSAASSASSSVSPVVPVVGTSWTLGTFPTSVTTSWNVTGVGSYIVLHNISSSTYYVTTNGSTWTSKTITSGMNKIIYYNGIYLAINNNTSWESFNSYTATYYTSTDLTNWTARTIAVGSNPIYSVSKLFSDGSSIMMAMGISTNTQYKILRTTDGVSWSSYDTTQVSGSGSRVNYDGPGYLNGYYYFFASNGGIPIGMMYTTNVAGSWTYASVGAPNYIYGNFYTKSDYSMAIAQGNGGSNGQYRVYSTPTNSGTYTNPGTGGWGTNVYTTFGMAEQRNITNAFIIALREMAGGGGTYYRSTTGLTNSWTAYTNTYFDGNTYYNSGNYAAGTMQATNYLFGANSYATSTLSGIMVASPVSSGTKSLYSIA